VRVVRSLACAAAACAGALALAAGPEPLPAAPERGAALYELRCGGCHFESVHGRERREARSFAEVRAWVSRWSGTLALPWTEEEIDEVAVYLNRRHYRYPCPPTACKVVSRGP
jgi:hypothetical protein